MKKRRVAAWRSLLFCCAVLFASHVALGQEKNEALAARIQPSIVAILTYGEDEAIMQRDSGFFVSKTGEVLTSLRILNGAKRIVVKTADGKIHKILKLVAADSKLFRLSMDSPGTDTQPLQLCSQIPKTGEPVAIIGPQGAGPGIQKGTILKVEEGAGYDRVIRVSADVSVGLTGAPVVNIKGEVIGIAVTGDEKGQAGGVAVLRDRVVNVTSDGAPVFGVRVAPTSSGDPTAVIEAAVMKGEAIKRVQPRPPIVRVSGTAVVEITVDEEGNVIFARGLSGHPLIKSAAENAAREWKFSPSTVAGIPVRVIGSLSFNFQ